MPTAYNVTQLKNSIGGFLQRKPEDFIRKYGADEVDCLLQACNNARLYAERKVDFEKSSEKVFLQIAALTDGVSLNDAITWETKDEVEADQVVVKIKKIVTPFIATVNSVATLVPVNLYSKHSWNARLKRNLGIITETLAVNVSETSASTELCVVQQGDTIFVSPASRATFPSGEVTLALDVVKWLDPYVDGDESDFLLEFCFDWLMYRSIYELNFFLKEDERVTISKEIMDDAWNSLVTWNNELLNTTSDDTEL